MPYFICEVVSNIVEKNLHFQLFDFSLNVNVSLTLFCKSYLPK